MPLYDYMCIQCQSVFEVRATFKEKEAGLEIECPKCNSKEIHQMISAGLVLRGSNVASLSMPTCGPNAGPGCCR